MTKALSLRLGFILLAASAAAQTAQVSPTDMAVNEGVVRQAETLVLRQKLADAQAAAARGDLQAAAKNYEEAYQLTQQIGPGISAETAQTVSGLASTRLQLARQAQADGNLREADVQVTRVLKVDPQNAEAVAFKKKNDQMLAALRGRIPDAQTVDQIPAMIKDKTDAATLVQDGKVLYEMGKLEEATAKFNAALKLDPDSRGANYYLNLTKQALAARADRAHTVENGNRMVEIEQAWGKSKPNTSLPSPNPYATTNLIYTGAGRQAIVSKLDRIRLDSVGYDGLPLSEVVRNLSEQTKLRDPEKRGVNFLINPNGDTSVPVATPGANGVGAGGVPGAPPGVAGLGGPNAGVAIDPATGLPINPQATAATAEQVDINNVLIKINPPLADIPLGQALDAICQVADHPIKYSIEDYAVVFSARGAETPMLYSRHFRVDPNTFQQGLQSVSAVSFGNTGSSGGGSGGGTGGGGGGGGGGNSQNQTGAAIPVIDAAPGESSARQSGGQGGGGGGGAGGSGGPGGLRYVTLTNTTVDVSVMARSFFTTLGVDLTAPGKSIFFNDRLGELFVRATQQDLDTIENALEVLNRVAPQVHIKARFIEVVEENDTALGFNWYLGNYVNGNVVANGGSAPSLNVPVSSANPLGTFPGNTPVSQIPGSVNDQNITSGLRNPLGAPALTTITGIMTDPNFRVVINALEQRSGTEELAEPEVVTTSGRQTQMRATQIISVVTGVNFQQGTASTTSPGTTTQ